VGASGDDPPRLRSPSPGGDTGYPIFRICAPGFEIDPIVRIFQRANSACADAAGPGSRALPGLAVRALQDGHELTCGAAANGAGSSDGDGRPGTGLAEVTVVGAADSMLSRMATP
jgi:hypothetical protein